METWFQVFPARGDTRLRLFAFPHAGGNAGFFRPWAQRMSADIELRGIELPARRARFAEPALTSIEAIVDGLYPAILPLLDRPFAFFGHSMGSVVAFELARRLRAASAPLPTVLVASARRAPQLPSRKRDLHDLPDVELISELAAMGGTGRDILREADLMQLLLPSLRADLKAIETYRMAPGEPLDVPLVAVGGTRDDQANREELAAWAVHTTRPLDLHQLDGGHFYVSEKEGELVSWLRRKLI